MSCVTCRVILLCYFLLPSPLLQPGAPLPPVLPKTLLAWIVPLLRLSESRVIAAVGLDVAMLLRFIRFGEVACVLITRHMI